MLAGEEKYILSSSDGVTPETSLEQWAGVRSHSPPAPRTGHLPGARRSTVRLTQSPQSPHELGPSCPFYREGNRGLEK